MEGSGQGAVEQHLARLGRSLWLVPWRRSRVLREARDHLAEAIEEGLARGLSEGEAEVRAVRRFGASGRVVRAELRLAGPVWVSMIAVVAALSVSATIMLGHRGATSMLRDTFNYQVVSGGGPGIQPFGTGRARFTLQVATTSTSGDVWLAGLPGRAAIHLRDGRWSVTPTAYSGVAGGVNPTALDAIAPVSATDAWAVGWEPRPEHAIIEHWDGHMWRESPTPIRASALDGVAAAGSSHAWAVGSVGRNATDATRPVLLRFNGRAWTEVRAPWERVGEELDAVDATSPSDVWVIGSVAAPRRGRPSRALLEHWNGARWQSIRAPFGATRPIGAFSEAGSNDAWAVGTYEQPPDVDHPIAAHWNGRIWEIARTPQPSPQTMLTSVVAVRSNDAWALGHTGPSQGWPLKPMLLHWNGEAWRVVPGISRLPNVWTMGADRGQPFLIGSCAHQATVAYILQLHNDSLTNPVVVPTTEHEAKRDNAGLAQPPPCLR